MTNTNVLAFGGEIDISRRLWVEQKLGEIKLLNPKSATIVDLTDVRYADTTLLNALVAVREHIICIVAPRDIVRLFKSASLDRVFPMFDDLPSARLWALSA